MRASVSFLFCLVFSFHVTFTQAQERHWVDYAKPMDVLKERHISALAVADNHVYVASGFNLFVVNLGDYSLTDVTPRIKKAANDEITELLVDPSRKELWVALNGNTYLSLCYSYSLDLKQSQGSFLNDRMQQYEELGKNSPRSSSINTLDFDDQQAIVGFFKGSIYLYSYKLRKYTLAYKPTSIYNSPVCAVLGKATAFVSTRGDGLIAIDRKTAKTSRFFDSDNNHIGPLASDGLYLYIGAKGLYKAKATDFRPSSESFKPTPQNSARGKSSPRS